MRLREVATPEAAERAGGPTSMPDSPTRSTSRRPAIAAMSWLG
jgi:hypothetical protein